MSGAIGLTVQGVEDFRKASKKLDDIATRKIKQTLRREMVAVTKPTRVAIKATARAEFPQKGKLNRWAAVTPTAKTRFSGRDEGVSIELRKRGHDIAALNRGRVRHPLFGNRRHWFTQEITPGFFTRTIEADVDGLRKRLLDALADAVRRAV